MLAFVYNKFTTLTFLIYFTITHETVIQVERDDLRMKNTWDLSNYSSKLYSKKEFSVE